MTTTTTAPTMNNPPFISWLLGLAQRDDRGRLAALRRGLLLEPHQFYELYRVVPAPFLDEHPAEVARRLAVAVLFATHPLTFSDEQLQQRRRNLGESLRMLAIKQAGQLDPDEGPPDPLKRRLDVLLAAHPDELFGHLRHVIRLLKSHDIPVDWSQLLWDMRQWEKESRPVQWRWSQSFYVGDTFNVDDAVDNS